MKVAIILFCFLLTSSAIGTVRVPDREADIAAKLRGVEQLKFNAQQHRNGTALDEMLDDSLMWVNANGVLLTKAGFLERLHKSPSSPLRIVPESMTVNVFDHLAIVVGIYDEKGTRAGQPYQQRCRFIDSWSFKNGKWVLIAATATSTIS